MKRLDITYGAALKLAVSLMCVLCASCADDIDLKLERQKRGFAIVGDPVEVRLGVAVSDLAMNVATRAEDPAEYNVEDTEEERRVDDLWIFEYDYITGELVYTPTRVTVKEQSELAGIPVTLSDNHGRKVILHVVANSGSGVSGNSAEWVAYNDATGAYDGFMTVDELGRKAIPTPHPQRMTWDDTEGKYVIHPDDGSIVGDISVPMSGRLEGITVDEDADLLVTVERMFAKILVRVDLSGFSEEYESAWLNTVTIGNIPEYCAVGTLWDGDDGDGARPGDYGDCGRWLQRAFNATGERVDNTGGDSASSGSDDGGDVYPYLIYVPENIQGENRVGGSTDKAENAPNAYALSVIAGIYVVENGSTLGEYASFTAYPGGNTTTNFNVRRNCVYRVTMRIVDLVDDALPSANCIMCFSGETTAFFPYCRTETGGGYDFGDYLYAYDDGKKNGQKIDHVGIIWQSTDGGNTVDYDGNATGFIGDNTKGDLVWIDDVNSVKDEYHRRIHVTVPEGRTGNALIGAYNSGDEIIWSWHVWSRERDNDPTTVDTKLYYTYDWDSDGIHDYYSQRPRVAGYTIMNCNLGAMRNEPVGSVYSGTTSGSGATGFNNARPTFGTLYQWGRKDPFPPITAHIAVEGVGGTYGVYTVFEEYDSSSVGNYFDNANRKVGIAGTNNSSALFHSVGGRERLPFNGMIPLTIQNPTVFYAGTLDVNYLTDLDPIQNDLTSYLPEPRDGNWMLDSSSDHYNRLWGGLDPEKDMDLITKSYDTGLTCDLGDTKNITIHLYDDYGEKSIFDPCPYGWRVSPPDLWLGFTDTGLNSVATNDNLKDVNYNFDNTLSNFSGMTMYLTAWREGETSFFPCQGTRAPDGCAFRSGQCGNYNNATADANDRVNMLHIHKEKNYFNVFENDQMQYYIKSTASPLRCVRIDSVVQ